MRILVFSAYWPRPDQVHKATFEVEQVAAFLEAGHEVDVIVATVPWRPRAKFLGAADLGLDPARLLVRQIVLTRLPEIFSHFPQGIRLNIQATGRKVRSWIKTHSAGRNAPDFIIVHGERNIGLSAGIWNSDAKWTSAMVVHGADPVLEASEHEFLQRCVATDANRGLSKIILVGNRLKSYARHLGYDMSRVTVIPNGFNNPKNLGRRIDAVDGPVRLVSVARLVPVKGIDDALHAVATLRIRRPELDWRYDVVGDGPERRKLEALTVQLGLECRVRFLGALPNARALQMLDESDIFVLPSWNEAFGLAYLEAMAAGLAVIGCRENGAADILTDGYDGRLVPPRDVDALAKALEDLVESRKRREALGRVAKTSVLRFSWAENACAVIGALQYERDKQRDDG